MAGWLAGNGTGAERLIERSANLAECVEVPCGAKHLLANFNVDHHPPIPGVTTEMFKCNSHLSIMSPYEIYSLIYIECHAMPQIIIPGKIPPYLPFVKLDFLTCQYHFQVDFLQFPMDCLPRRMQISFQ
jgi:hypothetical protein